MSARDGYAVQVMIQMGGCVFPVYWAKDNARQFESGSGRLAAPKLIY